MGSRFVGKSSYSVLSEMRNAVRPVVLLRTVPVLYAGRTVKVSLVGYTIGYAD